MKEYAKAKKLLLRYKNTIDKLKKLGVIRTTKVVSEWGEYVASKSLNLKLAPTQQKGYDATKYEKKYEIKARKKSSWSKPTVFPIKKEQIKTSDFIIYVEFDEIWNLVKLLKIPSKEVKLRLDAYNRVVITKDLVKKYSVLKEAHKKIF